MTLPDNQRADGKQDRANADQAMRLSNHDYDERRSRWQNPKLVAAYELGFGIEALPGFQQGPPPAADTIRLLISKISTAVKICAADLEEAHVAEFMAAVDGVRIAIDDLDRRPAKSVSPLELCWSNGTPVCHRLRIAGEPLIRHDRSIRKWFNLGIALGDLYYLACQGAVGRFRFATRPQVSPISKVPLPPAPVTREATFELPLEPLLKAIRNLPDERLRVMHSLAKLKGIRPQNEIQKIQYLGEAAGFADHDVECDHQGRMQDVLHYLNTIHREIVETLHRPFRADALAPASTPEQPSYTPEQSEWTELCFGTMFNDPTLTVTREGFRKTQLNQTPYWLLKELAIHGKKYPLEDGIFVSEDQLKKAWSDDPPQKISGPVSRLRKIVEKVLGLTIAPGKQAQRGKYRLEPISQMASAELPDQNLANGQKTSAGRRSRRRSQARS